MRKRKRRRRKMRSRKKKKKRLGGQQSGHCKGSVSDETCVPMQSAGETKGKSEEKSGGLRGNNLQPHKTTTEM